MIALGSEPALGGRLRAAGRFWSLVPAVLLAALLGGQSLFLFFALRDPSFAVEPNYYAKALAWDAHQAQARANGELGWVAALSVQAMAGARSRLSVTLRDRSGALVSGAALHVDAFPKARGARQFTAQLSELPDGSYVGELASTQRGLWEFRLHAERGQSRYTAVVAQDVGAAARGAP